MSTRTSSQVNSADRLFITAMAVGAMFVAGYTVVRVSLSANAAAPTVSPSAQVNVVPSEGTLWSDFGG